MLPGQQGRSRRRHEDDDTRIMILATFHTMPRAQGMRQREALFRGNHGSAMAGRLKIGHRRRRSAAIDDDGAHPLSYRAAALIWRPHCPQRLFDDAYRPLWLQDGDDYICDDICEPPGGTQHAPGCRK